MKRQFELATHCMPNRDLQPNDTCLTTWKNLAAHLWQVWMWHTFSWTWAHSVRSPILSRTRYIGLKKRESHLSDQNIQEDYDISMQHSDALKMKPAAICNGSHLWQNNSPGFTMLIEHLWWEKNLNRWTQLSYNMFENIPYVCCSHTLSAYLKHCRCISFKKNHMFDFSGRIQLKYFVQNEWHRLQS